MARAVDVARYIVDKHPAFGEVRVQKLCYFAQGWTLAITDQPLFDDELQAWKMGPVSPAVHRAFAAIKDGNPDALSATGKTILDRVLREYRWMTTDDMIEETHSQIPWLAARRDTPLGERSSMLLDTVLMRDEFSRATHTLRRHTASEAVTELNLRVAHDQPTYDLDELLDSVPDYDPPEDPWGGANLFTLPA